jgi:hypothetical protein
MRALILAVALIATTSSAVAQPRYLASSGVTIASASDRSPGVLDAHARKRHGEIVRRAVRDVLHRSGTTVRHAGVGARRIDIAVVGWRVAPSGTDLLVSAELRAVVSDERGKMLSIVTGRASISAPARSAHLLALREQVLAEAVAGMSDLLRSQVDRATS